MSKTLHYPSPAAVMWSVIVAVLLRETKTRFGRTRFGYLWAFIEPSVYVGLFIFIRHQLQTVTPFGENLALFFLTGLLFFRVFSSISTRVLSAVTANRALLAYPPVKPLDVILARVLLETLTMLTVFFIFMAFLAMTIDRKLIFHMESFAAAITCLVLLSTAFGVFNAVFSVIMPSWERIWTMLRLPILLLSSVFYVPTSLPPLGQSIISWNPLLHCIEWLRTSTYLTYDPMLSRSYVIGFGLTLLALGLLLERFTRKKLLES